MKRSIQNPRKLVYIEGYRDIQLYTTITIRKERKKERVCTDPSLLSLSYPKFSFCLNCYHCNQSWAKSALVGMGRNPAATFLNLPLRSARVTMATRGLESKAMLFGERGTISPLAQFLYLN